MIEKRRHGRSENLDRARNVINNSKSTTTTTTTTNRKGGNFWILQENRDRTRRNHVIFQAETRLSQRSKIKDQRSN